MVSPVIPRLRPHLRVCGGFPQPKSDLLEQVVEHGRVQQQPVPGVLLETAPGSLQEQVPCPARMVPEHLVVIVERDENSFRDLDLDQQDGAFNHKLQEKAREAAFILIFCTA